ncbi:MAG: thiamine phosphate synthase [Planctomycetes bacterium]|nr:thiamine phosphate synthase [Planctomycetota bacterium]
MKIDWTTRRLYLLFTPVQCAGEPWETLAAALRGGVQLVQWRVAEADPMGLQRCVRLCTEHDVPVLVNDHVALAAAAGAAGAHIGQDDMPAAAARALLGPERYLGISTHHADQVRRAEADGADYLGLGPCFPTATKGYRQGLDPAVLEAARRVASLPVFAIGGLDAARIAALRRCGFRHFAVSGAVLGAEDPEGAAAALRRAVDAD